MKNIVNRFVREEDGQDLIEYSLLAGLISVISYVAISNTGTAVNSLFTKVASQVTTAAGS